ncbi:hypothetical protein EDB89DRAFT_1999395 [Lactarius sanguifluus]|nr:hypothetical protein EDB89DRAFT_1999395 [Lactarius sanguifluus]
MDRRPCSYAPFKTLPNHSKTGRTFPRLVLLCPSASRLPRIAHLPFKISRSQLTCSRGPLSHPQDAVRRRADHHARRWIRSRDSIVMICFGFSFPRPCTFVLPPVPYPSRLVSAFRCLAFPCHLHPYLLDQGSYSLHVFKTSRSWLGIISSV